jgi:pimeloyl-ACP methyl ester carboxylesterase
MAQFVMVAGAWMGGWAWTELAPLLEERGHIVHRLSLTGTGERIHLATPEVGLEMHITDVTQFLFHEEMEDVVLVGHSYAGLVVTGVADRVPERIGTLVFCDTGPGQAGVALQDYWPEEMRAHIAAVMAAGDGFGVPLPPWDELGAFASTAGISAEQRERFQRLASPLLRGSMEQPLRLTNAPASGPYRRALITCAEGGGSLAQLQETIASGNPAYAPMASGDWDLRELPTGHWPMLSMPQELAVMLDEIAAAGSTPT